MLMRTNEPIETRRTAVESCVKEIEVTCPCQVAIV